MRLACSLGWSVAASWHLEIEFRFWFVDVGNVYAVFVLGE